MKRFFIIGNPRSGTTLLRLMLNKHQNISVPPEAGFLVWLYERYSDFTFNKKSVDDFVQELSNTTKIEHWNLDFFELNKFILSEKPDNFSTLMDNVYFFYVKNNLNKDAFLYGDKNNFYLHKIDLLSSIYKNAKFIHIIRDGRSVAVSYKELKKKVIQDKYAPNLPDNINNIAQEWISNINKINNSFEKLNSSLVYTVRFEDLVLEPEKTLMKICLFLNIDYDNEMLNYYKTTEEEGLEPSSFLKWKDKNKKPLQEEEVYKYKKNSTVELEQFEKIAQGLLSRYKYI